MNSISTLAEKCIKYMKWWIDDKHMNSKHPTLYSRYEEETKWSVTLGKYNHKKKEAQTVMSMTQESQIKPPCIHFIIQNICSPKSLHNTMGSHPHLLKQMLIYT